MHLEWHGSDGVEVLLYSDPVLESGEAGEAGMMPGGQPARGYNQPSEYCLTIYRYAIIVSNPQISCNIVWIHKRDIAEGWI